MQSQYFKGNVSPKGFSLIDSRAKEVAVAEGFLDYLVFPDPTEARTATDKLSGLNSFSFLRVSGQL